MASLDIEELRRRLAADRERALRETSPEDALRAALHIGDIPDSVVMGWETQAWQYPPRPPGRLRIVHYKGEPEGEGRCIPIANAPPEAIEWVDCLCFYTKDGLVGILNHYPADIPPDEKAGNVNIWIHPDHQRQGIATKLLDRAVKLFGPIDWNQQRYSVSGRKFINRYLKGKT